MQSISAYHEPGYHKFTAGLANLLVRRGPGGPPRVYLCRQTHKGEHEGTVGVGVAGFGWSISAYRWRL